MRPRNLFAHLRLLSGSALILTLGGCGGSQPEAASPTPSSVDWSAGAPAAEPAYTPQELARLSLCPLISSTAFVAAEFKLQGAPKEQAQEQLASLPNEEADEDLTEMQRQFVEMTYATDFDDVVPYTLENQTTCTQQLAELSGARAERAVFCLNRHLVVLASFRWKDKLTRAQISERLKHIPAYGDQYVDVGLGAAGNPKLDYWKACVGDAA